MTRATINNFVGLFGRQAPIAGLEIPRWVTIYVDHISQPETRDELHAFIQELVEGCAVVGAVGVTVAFPALASEWNREIGDNLQQTLLSSVSGARPYFRCVVCNQYALEQDPSLTAGKLVVLTDSEYIGDIELPSIFLDQEAICIDYRTTLVAKTAAVTRLVRDAIEQVADQEVRKLPHWEDGVSETLLNSTTILLALNVMCKPQRFATNMFLFAYDYMDHIVAEAFNDRNLRARWRKTPRTAVMVEGDANNA